LALFAPLSILANYHLPLSGALAFLELSIKHLLILITFLICSFTINGKVLNDKHYDEILIGMWSGNAPSDDGYYKNWIHKKNSDGSYQTSFFYYKDGLYEYFEKVSGKWWVSEGTLYQFESWMDKPITYTYLKLENGCIKYTLVTSDFSADVSDGYSFNECVYES